MGNINIFTYKMSELAEQKWKDAFNVFDLQGDTFLPVEPLFGEIVRAMGLMPSKEKLVQWIKSELPEDFETIEGKQTRVFRLNPFIQFMKNHTNKMTGKPNTDDVIDKKTLEEALSALKPNENSEYLTAKCLNHILTEVGDPLTKKEMEILWKAGWDKSS